MLLTSLKLAIFTLYTWLVEAIEHIKRENSSKSLPVLLGSMDVECTEMLQPVAKNVDTLCAKMVLRA